MFVIHMVYHTILTLAYWLMSPLSWDISRLCFSVSSFLINELIELCGNTIPFNFILGKCKLYCYISETRYMDDFNKRSHEKSRVNWK
ncbi:hypothetical protein R3W88_031461 [Solanum pinnatisectum]|uniref:Uncharacterized protein n=1 Tax=Solanum pinnatisectum TaxID=50273 RepID=A0AAV9LPT8_9SOLN|nr:hypothetical protein R3W88_031461 [Solanum pinnatisectum]